MPNLQRTHMIQLPHNTTYQGGLTLAVLAYKRYFLAATDGERSMLKYHMFAKILPHIFGYHGIVAAAWRWWKA